VEIIEQWRNARDLARHTGALNETLTTKMRLASRSRWLRLGRAFGVGPKLG
jgi:hypothetical protein